MGANVAATTRTAIFGRGMKGKGNKTSGTLISDSRNREHGTAPGLFCRLSSSEPITLDPCRIQLEGWERIGIHRERDRENHPKYSGQPSVNSRNALPLTSHPPSLPSPPHRSSLPRTHPVIEGIFPGILNAYQYDRINDRDIQRRCPIWNVYTRCKLTLWCIKQSFLKSKEELYIVILTDVEELCILIKNA